MSWKNRQRFEKNAVELQQAMALIQKAAQSPSMATDMGRGLVDILSRYKQILPRIKVPGCLPDLWNSQNPWPDHVGKDIFTVSAC